MPWLLSLFTSAALASDPTFTCDDTEDEVSCNVWVTPNPGEPGSPAGHFSVGFLPPASVYVPVGTVTGDWDSDCPQGEGADIRIRPSGVVEVRAQAWADKVVCSVYAGDNMGGVWVHEIYVGDLGGNL